MQYREFGKLGFKVSAFGFGCMRLPVLENDSSKINEPEAIKMIRYAIDNGVNYFDTAYVYHGGKSELLVAKAIKDGYREKIKLATKLPVWKVCEYADFELLLDEQLKKLEVDYIDFYLLHGLNKGEWAKLKKLNVFKFLDNAVASGKIKYPSFSFHDELSLFKEIIDSYPWKMCQMQFNYLDTNYQAGTEGLQYAASKGVPVVVMEPLRGGSLSNSVPNDVKKIFDEAQIKRSPADWAFRWIGNFKEVVTILSGVNTMEQLMENVEIFDKVLPNTMSKEELAIVDRVVDIYNSRIKVGCTQCAYCMPCPSGVNIPEIFKLYNEASIFDRFEKNSENYKGFIKENSDASHCAECGSCEAACPQHISIIERLKEASSALSR